MANNFNAIKTVLASNEAKTKFSEVLGGRTAAFIASILSAVSSNKSLQECEVNSVVNSALIAATLDLPINPNLGFAAIVPYRTKNGGSYAQFQMMWRGYVQLAQRTGRYQTIHTTEVREGDIKRFNRFTGEIEFNEISPSDHNYPKRQIIGYVAYIKLLDGFEKTLYMSQSEVYEHAMKYSSLFKSTQGGMWADNFDAMAKKTVLKLLISRWGIMSIEVERAITFDQSVVDNPDHSIESFEPTYIDNQKEDTEPTKVLPTQSQSFEGKEFDVFELVKGDKKQAELALLKGLITFDQYNSIP